MPEGTDITTAILGSVRQSVFVFPSLHSSFFFSIQFSFNSRRMCPHSEPDRLEKKRQYRKGYYAENIFVERKKARERAQRSKAIMSDEEKALCKEKHRAAQSRYHTANRDKLNVKKRMARFEKKQRARQLEDEALFQQLMESGAAD
ncbi:hypothetical protein CPC08DRAFT_728988 [Agrocybe pediades]|nr:hypothetical protein CPC08DRAFT_728988 [Agrocybe pediades]